MGSMLKLFCPDPVTDVRAGFGVIQVGQEGAPALSATPQVRAPSPPEAVACIREMAELEPTVIALETQSMATGVATERIRTEPDTEQEPLLAVTVTVESTELEFIVRTPVEALRDTPDGVEDKDQEVAAPPPTQVFMLRLCPLWRFTACHFTMRGQENVVVKVFCGSVLVLLLS